LTFWKSSDPLHAVIVKLLQQINLLWGKTMIGLGFSAQLRFRFVSNSLCFFWVWCRLRTTCVLVYTCIAFRQYMVGSHILTIQYMYLVST
jgi:hypothetical protein